MSSFKKICFTELIGSVVLGIIAYAKQRCPMFENHRFFEKNSIFEVFFSITTIWSFNRNSFSKYTTIGNQFFLYGNGLNLPDVVIKVIDAFIRRIQFFLNFLQLFL